MTASSARPSKSTGPRTQAGKARASQNAFKHGLARGSRAGDPLSQRLMQALCTETGASLDLALEVAQADFVLRHVVRAEIDALSAGTSVPSVSTLDALITFSRYERRARSRLRTGLKAIESSDRPTG